MVNIYFVVVEFENESGNNLLLGLVGFFLIFVLVWKIVRRFVFIVVMDM